MNETISEDKMKQESDVGISHRLTFLLNRVVSVLVDASSPYFRSLGLSIPAVRALIAIHENGGEMTVGALAEKTAIDLSTMSHILKRLEKQHLLTRTRLPDDNRVVCAALTTLGGSVAKECHAASLKHEAILLGDMSAEEAELLKRMLVRLYENAKEGFGN